MNDVQYFDKNWIVVKKKNNTYTRVYLRFIFMQIIRENKIL